jgi:hypothetical protein
METLGMMTKYQLVFIKLETALEKLIHIFRFRNQSMVASAFFSLVSASNTSNSLFHQKKILLFKKIQSLLTNNIFGNLKKFRFRVLAHSFGEINNFARNYKRQKKYKEELRALKEENDATLMRRDQDIKILGKKNEDLKKEIANKKKNEEEPEYDSKGKKINFIPKLKIMEKKVIS